MNKQDRGSYYMDKDGAIWFLLDVNPEPTATLVDYKTGKQVIRSVSTLNREGFVKLIPENK